MHKLHAEPVIQEVKSSLLEEKSIKLSIKREDLIHPLVSGNKWRKLKYNLQAAHQERVDTILTFGGAYSNHIYATAAAAKEAGFKSIGIVRGEELQNKPLNKTLQFASANGMRLKFVSRKIYREKAEKGFVNQLRQEFGKFYLIPEGGTNALAIKGCEEILNEETKKFDVISSSAGTGGTLSGLISSSQKNQTILGFSALKGDFLVNEIYSWLYQYRGKEFSNWKLNTDYHFGGYAKSTLELLEFIDDFEDQHQIPLEPIYTGKMMFGLFDLISRDHFKKWTQLLAIHTGGLQGKH